VRQEYKDDFTTDSADAICIGKAGLLELNKNRSAF
jgi:Asp/Glu/hydantoin racemase